MSKEQMKKSQLPAQLEYVTNNYKVQQNLPFAHCFVLLPPKI